MPLVQDHSALPFHKPMAYLERLLSFDLKSQDADSPYDEDNAEKAIKIIGFKIEETLVNRERAASRRKPSVLGALSENKDKVAQADTTPKPPRRKNDTAIE